MTFLLQAREISFSYPGHHVIKNLNMELGNHEFVLLTGANGAGKTTLLKILCGLFKIQQGKIIRSRIPNFFTPDGFLYDELTVKQNLHIYGSLSFLNPDRMAKVIAWFQLDPFLSETVKNLSWGQKMRAGLARTFLRDAPLYLLDEPLVGLDENSAENLLGILKQLKEEKKTLLIASHHTKELKNLADRSLTLADGQLK